MRCASFVEVGAEVAHPRREHELSQRLRFDLTDALARELERGADLFERPIARVVDAEAHPNHALLARREKAQDRPRLARERGLEGRARGLGRPGVAQALDEARPGLV